jgi:predicted nucleotidyltransferase component of viral defense system
MNSTYKEQVRLLLRTLPIIHKETDFAVHGGTAINLFVKDLLRYSVDVDLTYIPLEEREKSLQHINAKLGTIATDIKHSIPNIKIKSVPNKLLCTLGVITIKIEVNGIQRGIIGETVEMPLCAKAQAEFELSCEAKIVSISQLYGGKIGAALNRQHPRDLFDYKYMNIPNFEDIKQGLMYNILSSPKPVVELLSPNPIDQKEALENQFRGMTDIPFTYEEYEQMRQRLITFVNSNISQSDKEFLISYEEGNPLWDNSEYENFKLYPSIQWKQLNINKLKQNNLTKHKQGIEKLAAWLKGN